jgi:hypothetical protein
MIPATSWDSAAEDLLWGCGAVVMVGLVVRGRSSGEPWIDTAALAI